MIKVFGIICLSILGLTSIAKANDLAKDIRRREDLVKSLSEQTQFLEREVEKLKDEVPGGGDITRTSLNILIPIDLIAVLLSPDKVGLFDLKGTIFGHLKILIFRPFVVLTTGLISFKAVRVVQGTIAINEVSQILNGAKLEQLYQQKQLSELLKIKNRADQLSCFRQQEDSQVCRTSYERGIREIEQRFNAQNIVAETVKYERLLKQSSPTLPRQNQDQRNSLQMELGVL